MKFEVKKAEENKLGSNRILDVELKPDQQIGSETAYLFRKEVLDQFCIYMFDKDRDGYRTGDITLTIHLKPRQRAATQANKMAKLLTKQFKEWNRGR